MKLLDGSTLLKLLPPQLVSVPADTVMLELKGSSKMKFVTKSEALASNLDVAFFLPVPHTTDVRNVTSAEQINFITTEKETTASIDSANSLIEIIDFLSFSFSDVSQIKITVYNLHQTEQRLSRLPSGKHAPRARRRSDI